MNTALNTAEVPMAVRDGGEGRLRICMERFMADFNAMASFGRNQNGGIDRSFASPEDRRVRQWILGRWRAMGLEVSVDPIANLWGRLEGEENLPPIVIGSHHDAVPDGGRYDGAMGVMMATEAARTLIENGVRLRHPLCLISFTAEEPNTFNLSTLGSKVVCGRLKKEDLAEVRDRSGQIRLTDALKELGGDPDHLERARIRPGGISCFLEAHNELGRQLESAGSRISGVSMLTGLYREKVRITGEANHAGTTMMQDRRDASLALDEMALALERAARERRSPNVTATMGYVKLSPNEANIIPGSAEGVIDIRTSKEEDLNALLAALDAASAECGRKRKVRVERECILSQKAQPMDGEIAEAVQRGIRAVDEPPGSVISMAGHDAANMQRIAPSGMIFVRSVGGYGHCRREYCREEDMEKAANAMLETIRILDEQMED